LECDKEALECMEAGHRGTVRNVAGLRRRNDKLYHRVRGR